MISIEEDKLEYPITITLPENYWTYSINKNEEKDND